ncbi:MAG: UDP-N-acetylglucosamine 2-epimerase (non-hydrolyzing) [Chloroflexi bacterium HGW-Chloroflexi-6]|nr:MAG: UDP-N-acetylglucosamine 2-epimerase (non-hydrolyzing) [Chloroflexi bacterium HGW-Chloroflexi-6]
MSPFRILSVIGTRPEAVKMAPVVQRLRQTPGVESLVCATAQHRQMLDQVLNLFDITPDVDLNLMKPNQSLAGVTAAIFTELDPVLRDLRPDWVLAQGDTTTVMATAMLAYYNRIRFGHVEAGLRTGDKFQPFPEEVNRMVAGVVADLHFAPTEWSKQNLLRENVPADKIIVTGNPVIDALQQVAEKPVPPETQQLLKQVGNKRILLVTAHRRENFGEPLENICAALQTLAETYQNEIQIIYPVHLNPNVQGIVQPRLGNIPNITLLPPLDYLPMVQLMKHSFLVLTDSGGIQEEAPGFGIPVLVMRATTERPEGVQAGTVRLIGTQTQDILTQTRLLLDDPQEYAHMAQSANPYGDGYAAQRIVQALVEAG